jgi:hypothetical protein
VSKGQVWVRVCVVWCGVVWCGVVWCGVVWCGVVWCGVVWCGVVWVSVRCEEWLHVTQQSKGHGQSRRPTTSLPCPFSIAVVPPRQVPQAQTPPPLASSCSRRHSPPAPAII